MELPTYTSIWRIEKRLYKLYDFRLPMPLPVGQIAVFTAVTVPYIVLLTLFGLPFNHTLFWLYVLPPGLLTWLATRPVLESKRLPELLTSQMRYLGEPSTWCRMAPLTEKDTVMVSGRVWRRAGIAARAEPDQAAAELPAATRRALPAVAPVARPVRAHAATGQAATDQAVTDQAAGERGTADQAASEHGTADQAAGNRTAGTAPARGPGAAARGRSRGRGRLVRERRVPERQVPERVQARPPQAEQARPERARPERAGRAGEAGAGQEGEGRWPHLPGPAPRPSAARPPAARPDRAFPAREPGLGEDAYGTVADWARDAGLDPGPGPAGSPGTGRHAGGARPPALVGYAPGGVPPGGPVPGEAPTGEALTGEALRGDAAAGGVGGSAVTTPRQAGDAAGARPAGPDAGPAGTGDAAKAGRPAPGSGTPTDPGTGWPLVGYPTVASLQPGKPVSGSPPGQEPAPIAGEGTDSASVNRGTGGAVGTGWPAVGYPAGPSVPPIGARPQEPAQPLGPEPAVAADPAAAGPAAAGSAVAGPAAPEPAVAGPAIAGPAAPEPAAPGTQAPGTEQPGTEQPGTETPSTETPSTETPSTETPDERPSLPRRPAPVVIVPAQRSVAGPARATPARRPPAPGVERALSGPGAHRPAGWRSHVTVVPGGRGPGRPDPVKEARDRAVLPLDRPRLVVVLGCTVGAGQTVTTLMLADLLAGLRGEPVAALDLNPGPTSLTELAHVPAITVNALLADRAPGAHAAHSGNRGPGAQGGPASAWGARNKGRLDVICQDAAPGGGGPLPSLQHDRLVSALASRYSLTLADPGASAVAKLLAEAGQLVLVAPASPDAARAVSMTCEWLGGHGHGALARRSIAVLNGVSQRSVSHAEQAEVVLRGRCRAIVRVPWDDHLAEPEAERGIRDSLMAAGAPPRLAQLRPAVLQAYTALAGVLVSALADDLVRRRAAR